MYMKENNRPGESNSNSDDDDLFFGLAQASKVQCNSCDRWFTPSVIVDGKCEECREKEKQEENDDREMT